MMEFHFSKKIELVEYAMPFNMSFAKLYILNSEHIGIVIGFGFSNEMQKICFYLMIASLLYILYFSNHKINKTFSANSFLC